MRSKKFTPIERRRRPVHPDERYTPIMPPRKRDWKSGTTQLGLFIRTESGATIVSIWNTATALQAARAHDLIRDQPGDVYAALAEALDMVQDLNGDPSSCPHDTMTAARAIELREAFKR